MSKPQLAQVNIARMKAPLESPVMAGFVARLDEINALADRSSGFVWRLQTGEGNATYLRPYGDDRILFNLSVWESIEHLRDYVYRSAHVEVLRNRDERFNNPIFGNVKCPSSELLENFQLHLNCPQFVDSD